MKVLDSTFLIDILRKREETEEILNSNDELFTTQINMYEIIEGFFSETISTRNKVVIRELFESIKVLPLNDMSIIKAAEIHATLSKQGDMVDYLDCLIAGIALANNISTIVTKNVKHFERIDGIKVESY